MESLKFVIKPYLRLPLIITVNVTTFRRRRLNSSVVNAIGKFQTNLDPVGYKVLWIAFTGINCKFLRLPKKTKSEFTFAIWLQTIWQDHLA